MKKKSSKFQGKHFLQIPGPTNVPERVLNAMNYPTIDHRGTEFADLGRKCLDQIKTIFKTKSNVVIFPSSGTGAWEAAIVNTLNEGDTALMVETGHFASLWEKLAKKFKIKTKIIKGSWRTGVDPDKIKDILCSDIKQEIKAVCVVHNETSTGCTSNIKAVRDAINFANHKALLMVDTISSLASINYEHDSWEVDVTVGGSQKGLMLPPGLSFNAISRKALNFSKYNGSNRSYWDWEEHINSNKNGQFPYTPATNMLYGLTEAIDMLHEEGLDNVFKRHKRHADATRKAVQSWGLEILCENPQDYSNSLTAVLLQENYNADHFRKIALEKYNLSLGNGLSRLAGKVFRIGHLGDFNDLMLLGTLSGIEMTLKDLDIPFQNGGVLKAMQFLQGNN